MELADLWKWKEACDTKNKEFMPSNALRVVGSKYVVINPINSLEYGDVFTLVYDDTSIAPLFSRLEGGAEYYILWYRLQPQLEAASWVSS